MKCTFFLLILPLLATVNEPFRAEWTSGYRNDRIHWHLQEPGSLGTVTYSEIYRDVEYWENGLVLSAVHRDLTFYLRGGYGAFGKGNIIQNYRDLPNVPQGKFRTTGWTADAVGYFGYAVNLTQGRTYKVILTPLIGYSGYFEQLKRSGGTDTSSLPGTFRLVWNGVFFGGNFSVQPNARFFFKAGYSYHLMDNRIHTHLYNSFGGGVENQSIRSNSGGNSGQTGTLQMDWILNSYWRIGLNGLIHYFSTRVVDTKIRQSGRGDFSEKLKLRWTVVSGGMQLSRQF